MMVDKWIEGDRGMVLRADLTVEKERLHTLPHGH